MAASQPATLNKGAVLLVRWMFDNDMVQSDVERLYGVPQHAISRYVNGTVMPCVKYANGLAKASGGRVSTASWSETLPYSAAHAQRLQKLRALGYRRASEASVAARDAAERRRVYQPGERAR